MSIKKLINAIDNKDKFHRLYGYPEPEKEDIIQAVRMEFNEDVEIFHTLHNVQEIRNSKKRIKFIYLTEGVLKRLNRIKNFRSVFSGNTIFVFFIDENKLDSDVGINGHAFLNYLEDEISVKNYYFSGYGIILPPRKTPDKIARWITYGIMAFSTVAYSACELDIVKKLFGKKFETVLKILSPIGFSLGLLNLICPFNIFDWSRKNVEPSLKKRLNKFFTKNKHK